MKILVEGQEREWTSRLAGLCRECNIAVYTRGIHGENKEMDLILTDHVPQERKGICKEIPFLILSKYGTEKEILQAFSLGAEDYLIQPVSPAVVLARIQSILGRYKGWKWELDQLQQKIMFTPNEYRIMLCLMEYPGKVFTRTEIIEKSFPDQFDGLDRGIDNYVKQIRKKLLKTAANADIITVYGVGYKYEKK